MYSTLTNDVPYTRTVRHLNQPKRQICRNPALHRPLARSYPSYRMRTPHSLRREAISASTTPLVRPKEAAWVPWFEDEEPQQGLLYSSCLLRVDSHRSLQHYKSIQYSGVKTEGAHNKDRASLYYNGVLQATWQHNSLWKLL